MAADLSSTGATQAIARFACRRPEEEASGPVNSDAVARALVDTVGVTIAGTDTEPTRLLSRWLQGERAPGAATVWGTDDQLSASQAALLNGTAAHALDWDDASPSMAMHPGAVLYPALLAQASLRDVSGAALVEGFNIGSAVFRAVSQVLPLAPHYGRGWHNTSTTGRLAAVAALAHLASLEEAATRRALGIAASLASGSLANFGTMTKPLHAGLAARDAVMAVGLAESGFTANETQLEAGRGFFAMYGETDAELLATLPDRLEDWRRRWVEDWAVKRYPSCYATHRSLDAVLAMREEVGSPDRVAAVEVAVRKGGRSPLIDHAPTTGLEGKFSLEFTVALALVRGHVQLTDFTDENVRAPDITAVMDRVTVVETDTPEGSTPDSAPYSVVRVDLTDGRSLTRRVDVTYGDARNPMDDEDVLAKFVEACGSVGWKEPEARALAEDLRRCVREPSLRDIQDRLRTGR